MLQLQEVLLHPNARVINQNLSFDIQYLFWRFFLRPKAHFDTMIAQNVLFPSGKSGDDPLEELSELGSKPKKARGGMAKSLDFLASMWCKHYIYWKDDGKFWKVHVADEEIWKYNCLDCVYTFEVYEAQQRALEETKLTDQMAFQMKTFENLMGMMLRGVRVNAAAKLAMLKELTALIAQLHKEVEHLAGRSLVGDKGGFSPKQVAEFFYTWMKFPPIYRQEVVDGQRKSVITADEEALKKIAKKNLWIKPLIGRINMIRSYEKAVDVCKKRIDIDGRWRTSYNVAGTSTFRLSSSENPFDSGLNLQNLTIGRDILQ